MTNDPSKIRITAEDATAPAINSVRGRMGELNTTTTATIASFGSLSKMLTGGAVIGGLGLIAQSVRSSIADFDALGKSAQGLGVSVQSLSRLTFAAKFSDLGAEQLSNGIRSLTQTIAETPDKLSALGISATDASGGLKAADAVLLELAERFSMAPDGIDKTNAAIEVFGKRVGPELIPFLNQGRIGISALSEQADALGATVNQEMSKDAERFNDAIALMGERASGFGKTITADLVKPLADLAEGINRFADNPAAMGSDDWLSRWFDEKTGAARRAGIAFDQFRVSLFETIGADKLASIARADLESSIALDQAAIARMSERLIAPRGASGAALERFVKTPLPTIANQKKQGPASRGGTDRKSDLDRFNERIQASELADYYKFNSEEELAAVAEKNTLLSEENQRHLAEIELQHRESRERILADYMHSSEATMRIAAFQIQWEKLSTAEKTNYMLGEAQQLTAGLATISKAAFGLNKAAAISQTVMTTYEGAQKAFTAYAGIPIVGPVLGAVAAASAIAMGLQRVKAIKSTQFGGGAVGSIPSLSGGIASAQQSATQPLLTADPPITRAQSEPAKRNVTIILESDSGQVSTEWVANTLMPRINELVGSGYELTAQRA